MTHPSYALSRDDAALCFDFESINDRRIIHKRVLYSPTIIPDLYNLALGDVEINNTLNDTVRSGNEDRNEIIATVVQTLLIFFQSYPHRAVYFEGSDPEGVRTRLYRAVISRELDNTRESFDIYGMYDDQSVEFFERYKPYVAFIIRRKS
jgi:hypothetical protein